MSDLEKGLKADPALLVENPVETPPKEFKSRRELPEVQAALREHLFVAVRSDADILVAVGETRSEVITHANEVLGHPRVGVEVIPREVPPVDIIRGNPTRQP